MITLLAFLATLAVLIVVHEWGHYAAARWAGVKILRFSVGFGRPLLKRTDRHGTEWALAAIPMGGYVKMLDEREGAVAPEEIHRAFNRQPLGRRFAIVLAGPLANLALAILLLWGLYLYGVASIRPMLGTPPAASAAARAGIGAGEIVLELNGAPVGDWQDLAIGLLDLSGQQDARLVTEGYEGHRHERRIDAVALDDARRADQPLHSLGLLPGHPPLAPVLGKLSEGGAAVRAGLHSGDRIHAIDGVAVTTWDDLIAIVRGHPGATLVCDIVRAGQPLQVRVQADSMGQGASQIGRIGALPRIDPGLLDRLRHDTRYDFLAAGQRALAQTWNLSLFSLKMFWRMLVGEASLKNLSGPVSIADYASQSVQAGAAAYAGFLALISISLAVLNLLPIPVLDGGHLLYYLLEFVRGRALSERVLETAQRVGMSLLLLLMLFALYNDLTRYLQ